MCPRPRPVVQPHTHTHIRRRMSDEALHVLDANAPESHCVRTRRDPRSMRTSDAVAIRYTTAPTATAAGLWTPKPRTGRHNECRVERSRMFEEAGECIGQ